MLIKESTTKSTGEVAKTMMAKSGLSAPMNNYKTTPLGQTTSSTDANSQAERKHRTFKINKTPEEIIQKMTDPELYEKCKTYGMNARVWMRKFASLLPEVFKRQLYKKRGYTSIYEFAGKLAGLNNATTDKILRLSFRLQDKPTLKKQFYSGAQGWSKLEKVVYVATTKTDEFWAKKVETLPQPALEVYIKEYRSKVTLQSNFPTSQQNLQTGKNGAWIGFENQKGRTVNGISGTIDDVEASSERELILLKSLDREKRFASLSFPVSEELEHQLRLLKQKIEKSQRKTLSWNEVMEELLKNYEKSGKQENKNGEMTEQKPKKQIIIQLCPECLRRQAQEKAESGQVTRHIPAAIRNLVLAQWNDRCAYPDCRRAPDIFHHTKRFALDKQHDPNFIVPLCKSHERLVHSGLLENEEAGAAQWKLKSEPNKDDPKYKIDQKVNFYRRESG